MHHSLGVNNLRIFKHIPTAVDTISSRRCNNLKRDCDCTLRVPGPVQIHIEHLFRLYLLHVHEADGSHPPELSHPSKSAADGDAKQASSPKPDSGEEHGRYAEDDGEDEDEDDDEDDDHDIHADIDELDKDAHVALGHDDEGLTHGLDEVLPLAHGRAGASADSISRRVRATEEGRRRKGWIARRMEYGLVDVVLICFSLVNRTSFESVSNVWQRELEQFCPHVPFIVIGCKLDLRRPDPYVFTTSRKLGADVALTNNRTTPASIPRQYPSRPLKSIQTPERKASKQSNATGSPPLSPTSSSSTHNRGGARRPKMARSATTSTIGTNTEEGGERQVDGTNPVPGSPTRGRHEKGGGNVLEAKLPGQYREIPRTVRQPAPLAVQPSGSTNTNVRPTGPPLLRSLSNAPVLRRVLSARSSTANHPLTMSTLPLADGDHAPRLEDAPQDTLTERRPSIVHRKTSGSADDAGQGRKLEVHVRTNSQPTPTSATAVGERGLVATQTAVVGDAPEEAKSGQIKDAVSSRGADQPTTSSLLRPNDGSRRQTTGSSSAGGSTGSAGLGNPGGERVRRTRIEEPPLSQRHRGSVVGSMHSHGGSGSNVQLSHHATLTEGAGGRQWSQTMSYDEAKSLARRIGASGYIECSALTLVNVVQVFDEVVRIAGEYDFTPFIRLYDDDSKQSNGELRLRRVSIDFADVVVQNGAKNASHFERPSFPFHPHTITQYINEHYSPRPRA
ncbi:hypothetical protein PIIN_09327 [Serendipita indica DSM 11827]|uniref:Uncharacterized protein n=1 Tax=Serendipita indica (strain DSM 11827) TaxID=1109443 RepID=G4TVK0_SERID|nr:hypothetical protein PIIN_09327 [Serendipita indica DSM 11827]